MKLINFLLAEQILNKECPGIQSIIDKIADYFDGMKPKVKDITLHKYQEWCDLLTDDKMLNPDGVSPAIAKGVYTAADESIHLSEQIDVRGAVHEIVHGVISSTPSTKYFKSFEEGLTDSVALELLKELGIYDPNMEFGGYASKTQVAHFIKVIGFTLKEFANAYARADNPNRVEWLRKFLLDIWEQQGSPDKSSWKGLLFSYGVWDD